MNGPFSDQGREHPAFMPNGTKQGLVPPASDLPPPLPARNPSAAASSKRASVVVPPPIQRAASAPLNIDIGTFEKSPDGLDAPTARRLEEAFQQGFLQNVRQVQALGSEIDGNVYDFNADKEHLRTWDERAEANRFVMRGGKRFRLANFPHSPTRQFTVVRKPLFGTASAKISLSASVWSPMEALSKGNIPYGDACAGIEVVESILKQLLVAERQDIFHYVGICSTSGWDEALWAMPPDDVNYGVALIEPKFPGWAVSAPEHWTLALQRAFQPESEMDMRSRIEKAIASHPDLADEGGIVLLAEIAAQTGVDEELIDEEAAAFCAASPDFTYEFIEGSTIIRRLRD